jgi:hypothetical protein
MKHPSAEQIEEYVLTTFHTVPCDLPGELDEIELHALWCKPCLAKLKRSRRYIEALRTAAARLRLERVTAVPPTTHAAPA